jgi:hypothetical protein
MLLNYLSKPVFGQQPRNSGLVEKGLQDFLVGMTVIDQVLPNGLNNLFKLSRADSPNRRTYHLLDGDDELFH